VAVRNHRLAASDADAVSADPPPSRRPAPAERVQENTANSKAKLPYAASAALLFLFMAVLHSWPLASDPARLARLDNHDAELNTWIIAWVAHALPTQPLSLFEAPLFHPEHHTLAFSEHMFVPSVMGAPLLWAGASPVLVYNLLIMIGFALSGFAMYWLMAAWTGSTWAAIVAGLAYAFNAHVLTRFVHLQAQHVEFLPIVLYAFDRVLTERRMRDVLLLAGAFVLQSLCGNYLLVFTTYALIASAIVRWPELGNRSDPVLGWPVSRLVLAGVIAIVLLSPFLWPYYQVDREHGLARGADVVTQYNAGWRDYLVTGGRLHFAWWSHAFYDGRTALFPGFTVLALAAVALVSGQGIRESRIRMALAIVVVGVAFSFGTSLPGYRALHGTLPLLSGLRNVARWGWLALAGGAILAGFGVAALERRNIRSWRIVAASFCLLVTIEAIRTPVGYSEYLGIPRIYDRLASLPGAVFAEFPFYSGANVSLNGPYVLANTKYFRPLMNGYSSFHPETFEARGRTLSSFPGEQAIAELRKAGVTHVLVHQQAFLRRSGDAALKAIDSVPALELVAEDEGIRLYRLRPLAAP
jgi:hypothetical protein